MIVKDDYIAITRVVSKTVRNNASTDRISRREKLSNSLPDKILDRDAGVKVVYIQVDLVRYPLLRALRA